MVELQSTANTASGWNTNITHAFIHGIELASSSCHCTDLVLVVATYGHHNILLSPFLSSFLSQTYVRILSHCFLLCLFQVCSHNQQAHTVFSDVCIRSLKSCKAYACYMAHIDGAHAGAPIDVSYGALDNDMLLFDYGFIVPHNPYDCVHLSFSTTLLESARCQLRTTAPLT